jgi:3-oxoacyl-[acyl-carrier protein] reductase
LHIFGFRAIRRGVGCPEENAMSETETALPALDWTRLTAAPGARIVVAGGSGEIGRAIVTACVANDHRVAVLDLPSSLERHPPPPDVVRIGFDATQQSSVDSAFATLAQQWPAIDALVFVVGFTITPPARLDQVSVQQWDDVIAGNLRSGFLAARAALPLLGKSAAPCIVNVSSGLAVSGLPGFGPYSAAKAGLIALTKALAVELGPRVRANAVAPSAIKTAFMMGGTGRSAEDPAAATWFDPAPYVQAFPLRRMAEVSDIVGPVLFLLGPAARFITGQTLHINGGRFMP